MTAIHQDFDLCLEKTAQHEFVAYVPDGDGGRAAEHAFTLRTDTLKMREDLQRLEAYSLHKELVKDDFHVQFGQMLYQAVLGGDVGALFAAHLEEARKADMGLRLRVRVDEGVPELMNLPWEFLHDGDGFLVTRWETPLSRLPLGIARRDKRPLERTLRMLVVVSSPLDLPEHRVLNTEREQEVILAALGKLQRKGLLDIDFCEDAVLDTIQDYLSELEYDILHLTGHGVFNEARGRGELLLEDEQGNQQPLTNAEFAALLRGYPSLRLVVLSACQSARTAKNDGYAGLSRRLLKQGVPAVLAMQYSVLDEAATDFADRFYTGLANNKPLDVALTEARLGLQMAKEEEEGGERVDFSTAVLFLNDPACVSVAQVRPEAEEVRLDRPVDWSTVSVMEKGFVGRRRELRRIRHGFTSGRQRAFIIHGLGGIGKSVLATRAATKLQKHFAGVKAVRLTATTRPEDVLSELNAFLNLAGVNAFNQVIRAPAPLEAKTGAMAQILTQVPPLTKRELYGKLGGHPYTIDVFARRAVVTSVADVWLEIEDVEREMIEFTLLERTYAQLPPRAQTLLLRASILEEAPPLEALQWMMGDEGDAMPAVDAELKALLSWGMRARQETGRGEVVYPMHALVRDYARRRLVESAEDETALLLRAARFWELQAQQSHELGDWLRARDYYYRAEEYRKAWHIVEAAYEYLVRWGHIELTIKLLNESIETLAGTSKAVAIGNLANVYQGMGDYKMALKMYEQVKELFETQRDERNVAAALHQIGMVYHHQGNYAEAQARYEQSLEIATELGDRRGITASLHQLGRIHQEQGSYREALEKWGQALMLLEQLGSPDAEKTKHNLALLREEMGEEAFAAALAELGVEAGGG